MDVFQSMQPMQCSDDDDDDAHATIIIMHNKKYDPASQQLAITSRVC
jgi:hypothetical protein